MASKTHISLLFTGASGRIGKMVLHHWPRACGAVTPQYRGTAQSDQAMYWDPMTGPFALLEHQARTGAVFPALLMLAGITPGPGRDVALNRPLAEATLAAAHEAGIRRVLIASSSAVYGVGENLSEDAPCAPVNAYGHAKLDMEAACDPWRARGIEICLLRIGNVAGADSLLLNMVRGDGAVTLDIFDDGTGPIRSYIGPRSMAEALATLALSKEPLPQVLNFAAPGPVAMATLAEAAGANIHPRRASETTRQRITLDCSRLAAIHDFAPRDSDPVDMVRQWQEARAA